VKIGLLGIMLRLIFLAAVAFFISGCSTGTVNTAEDSRLTVISTSPSDNANVSRETLVSVTFNNDLNQSSVNNQTFYVKDPNGNLVAGTFTYDQPNLKMTFESGNFYNAGERYTVVLTTGIADTNGSALLQDYMFNFNVN
jgi:hypothetical protein